MAFEEVTIGDARLIRGDCREVREALGTAYALVTDPPYGISFDFTRDRSQRKSKLPDAGRHLHTKRGPDWEHNIIGDTEPFDPTSWLQFSQVILWGANHYANKLANSAAWLIWDKRAGGSSDDFADCELAWTNLKGPARLYKHLWRGVCRAGEENSVHGGKLYPSQKPLALMRWCLEKTTGNILDPYMGSGTTLVAAIQLGRSCIGIDISPMAFDIACGRVEAAYKQLDMFIQRPVSPAPTQAALF
jgi:site-specific DNA-methyltransferase (adenine-specific)/modification methylase